GRSLLGPPRLIAFREPSRHGRHPEDVEHLDGRSCLESSRRAMKRSFKGPHPEEAWCLLITGALQCGYVPAQAGLLRQPRMTNEIKLLSTECARSLNECGFASETQRPRQTLSSAEVLTDFVEKQDLALERPGLD